MRAQFVDIIRRQLGDGRDLTQGERTAVYERVRAFVQNHYRTQGFSQLDYMSASLTIEQAIAEVEAEFAEAPSFIDRALHQAGELTVKFKTKYGAFAGIVSTAADFIKPIFDLTQAIVIGSGVIGLGLVALARGAKTSRRQINEAATFCALLFICSATWLGFQTLVPGANASGAIAQIVPGAHSLQDALLASLGRIEDNTRRTAEGIERMEGTVRGTKRETSADPRKELINLGKNWNEEDFGQAFFMCDMRVLRLYKQAGMKIPRYRAIEFLTQPEHIECLREFRDQFVALGPELCFSYDFVNPIFHMRTAPVDWMKNAFKTPERRKFAEELCGEERLRREMPILYRTAGGAAPAQQAQPATPPPAPRPAAVAAPQAPQAPAFAPSQQAAASPQAAAAPAAASSVLSADEVRQNLISKNVDHIGDMIFVFMPDGTFEQTSGRLSSSGRYRVEADGRLCWQDEFKLAGCFQYYRKGNALHVKRADAQSRAEIGRVTVTARR